MEQFVCQLTGYRREKHATGCTTGEIFFARGSPGSAQAVPGTLRRAPAGSVGVSKWGRR